MKEWEGLSIPDGTLLRYYDSTDSYIGELKTDSTEQKRFVKLDKKPTHVEWVISQWDLYNVITPEQAMLEMLEDL